MLNQSHRRWNPLTGQHILVSPNRTQRPWQGKQEVVPQPGRPAHDPVCYLCPRNTRAGGRINPDYQGTFAFGNDFASLLPDRIESVEPQLGALFQIRPESGICRVVCFSPRHDLSLPELTLPELEEVLSTWTEETRILGENPDIRYVQVFENKGELMGCSNPHPHSQIWATEHLPNEPSRELAMQGDYLRSHGRRLLEDYALEELKRAERLVVVNDDWMALVPYWALWPFETMVLPRRPLRTLLDLSATERASLADLLKRLTTRYDNLFGSRSPIPWASTRHPSTVKTTRNGHCICIFTRHSCAVPQCASSWSDSRCWGRPDAIHTPKAPRCSSGKRVKSTTKSPMGRECHAQRFGPRRRTGGPPSIYSHIRQQQVTFDTMVIPIQAELLPTE